MRSSSEEAKGALSDQDVKSIIDELRRRYEPVALRCDDNRKQLFCAPEKDPVMPKHLGDVTPWQWDAPRQVWTKLKARLTENRAVVRAEPAKPTVSWREKADRLESVINDGFAFVEEREQIDIQGALSDGQLIDGLGVLHWTKAHHLWPEADGYDECDEECEGYELHESGRYRETDLFYQERRRVTTARAGFPFYVEVIPRGQVAFLPDRSLANGLGMVLVSREVGTMDYVDRLQASQALDIRSAHEGNPDVPVGVEREAPRPDSPSRSGWGNTLTVHQLWTRTEYYEVCEGRGVNRWQIYKTFRHHYGMPPFALCPADEFNDPDPLYQYLPALEGMFRLKPALDRAMTLYLALAEQVALPLYYWESISTQAPLLGEDGMVVTLSKNSLLAHKAPDGYKLTKMEYEVNEAFVKGVELARSLADEAKPDTGQAEVGATSTAWAIRLQQAQANVVPARYVLMQTRALACMFRNWAMIMGLPADEGGFGEPVTTFKRTKDGKIDRATTVWVEPEDIGSLDIGAHIEASSAQERITKVEHGKGLLADKIIDRYEFYEKYYGAESPGEMIQRVDAEQLVIMILPMLLRQELMKRYGQRVVLGPNGELLGLDGQAVDPTQALAGMGIQFPGAQQSEPQIGGGPAPGSQMETRMQRLNDLKSQSPDSAPLPGAMG